ncbi:MAG TPA: cation:dicarboxylase symporter family transporter [Saprospiraceae bacterium]|nr:cation:dicarboxylase symporter family transporter [Saprospiraceae bacterium]
MPAIFKNLTFWVLSSICLGIAIGHFFPEVGISLKVIGTWFIDLVKLFIAPIIFLTIVLGFVGMDDLKKVGKVGLKALIYFEVVTTFALIIGIIVAYVIQPGKGLIPPVESASNDVASYAEKAKEGVDWMAFFAHNITIQVLVLSIVVGILLSKYQGRQKHRIVGGLQKTAHFVFLALKWLMYLSPLGALGGMAFTIGKYGLASLLPLAELMVTVYTTMAIFIFLVLRQILKYYQIDIMKFLKIIKEESLIVLGTSSSEAALPNLMQKLELMGCHKSVVGLVVPSGYSFNLDGTTIYLSMATIFLAQVYNVSLDFGQMLTVIGVLMVTSKGAAGVTGSGFVVLASTLSALGTIPIEGLALLLGVDRFMSEARAITNFIGNGVATIFISKMEGSFIPNDQYEISSTQKAA